MNALGFRVKSGYAIAIVLDGSAKSPLAVARHVVELCDPNVAGTRQPYHWRFGQAEEDQRAIAERVAIIERAAAQSVAALLAGAPTRPRAAGLVVGSVIDPAKVGNQHIRAHANEGKLFRRVLADALTARGIRCSVVVEKTLGDEARRALKRSDAEIKRTLTAFGTSLGSPWRSDEKAAATAAWMSLQAPRRGADE